MRNILRYPTDSPFCLAALLVALLLTLIVAPQAGAEAETSVEAEETLDPENPMAPFDRLVGGRWVLEDTYQTFEWGVGQKTVLAHSYARNEGGDALTAEGRWFWHPAKKAILGFAIALGMPFELLESNTRFEEDTMVSELTATDAGGNVTGYIETMKFVDDDRYLWTLYQDTSEGRQELMSGTFSRESP